LASARIEPPQDRQVEAPVLNAVAEANKSLFEDGPPLGVQRRLKLVDDNRRNVGRRAILVAVVG
jgi:hypothetical protein